MLTLGGTCASSAAQAQESGDKFGIAILFDRRNPELAPFLGDLKREISAVVGRDATVLFPEDAHLTNNFDPSVAQ
jgi:hypothetical protein